MPDLALPRAALYLRVSTDEQAVSAETQETEGRRFVARQGWAVAAVYADVGVSGANFTSRPGLLALLTDARSTPRPWDVLVIQRLDRLGRDAARTTLTLEDLAEHGVHVWSYAEGSRVELDPMGRAMASLKGVFAELERGLTVARVTEGLRAAAEQGRATGGRCYGYRTLRTPEGPRLAVHDPEAAIVRELFERRARGEGLRALVHDLNTRRVPPPRAGTGTWSPSALHALFRRPRYRGVLEYGATHKRQRGGRKERADSPERVIVTEAPALRIVPDALWHAVQPPPPSRAAPTKAHAKYLLTGHTRCGVCSGPMQVSRAKHGAATINVYLCGWARDRGDTVCTNKLRRPVEELDGAVLGWIARHVLDPAVVAVALQTMRAAIDAADARVP